MEPADKMDWQVAPGDVVVAGSDGLWDNLSQADIRTRVRSCLKKACPGPHHLNELQTCSAASCVLSRQIDHHTPGCKMPPDCV